MKVYKDTIISLTPISKSFFMKILTKLKKENDEVTCYELSALRRLPWSELWQVLRAIKSDKLFICYEESKAISLVPLLGIIAFFSKANRIWIIDNDVNIKPYQRVKAIGASFSLFLGSILAHVNLLKCIIQARLLKGKDRIVTTKVLMNNILYLKTNLWYGVQVGGSIGHISGVVNAFINKGYNVTYLSIESPVMLRNEVKSSLIPNIKYFGLPQEVNLYTFQRHVYKSFIRSNNIDKENFGYIYSRMAISNYANVLISRKLSIPLILEYNGSEVWVAEKWGSGIRYKYAAQLAEDICLKHAHLIVVVSQVLKDELIARGIEESRILFYPNCIDPSHFNPQRFSESDLLSLRSEYGLTKEHKIFTFVGTFGQWHGADILAKAIRFLCENNPDWLKKNHVHFMLVGDGLKMKEVKLELDNDMCKHFVTLTGLIAQQKAPIHLAMSDILVSPHVANNDGSKFFGSPTKLFEYMAMGKGIIASDLDQIGEVLKNSISVKNLPLNLPKGNESQLALLVTPGDVRELVKSIIFAVENDLWMNTLGRNAMDEANMKYTWDIHVGKIINSI